MNKIKYFEKFDLIDNPFNSEPVNEFEASPKGFINREKYIDKISMLLDDGKGSLKLVGDVGIGKTSLLKRVIFLARKKDYIVVEIDANKNYNFIAFYSALIAEFMKSLKNMGMISNFKEDEYQNIEKIVTRRIGKIRERFSKRKVEMIKNALAYLDDLFTKTKRDRAQ